MLFDKQLTLSDQQNLAGAIGAVVAATNVIDLGAPGITGLGATASQDVGKGGEVPILFQVTETFASAGAATLSVDLLTSAAADMSSPTVVRTTGVIAKALLVAGYEISIAHLPIGMTGRYLSAQYTIGTAATSAGKITAGVVLDRQGSI